MASLVEKCAAEFVGTFLLVFTVGCNVLAGNPVWGGVSIACSLMVGIYSLGGVSGANFNPAVSVALGLAGKMDDGWKQVGIYSGVQILAGIVASLCYGVLFGDTFNLSPSGAYQWWQAMLCEFLYTFMLCFVVLNVAASKAQGGRNQYYGLAIGYVIIAGAYGPGAVSGGCFNPAVAFAIDSSSIMKGFGWCIVYTVFELAGAAAAVGLFKLVRPEESTDKKAVAETGVEFTYTLKEQLIAEAIGTFMLVLTVGLNVLVESKAAAFSIAASLMCMIYAVGDISGGHYNPAVTCAIVARGAETDMKKAGAYVGTQLGAGLAGALMYALVHSGVTFPIGPGPGFSWASVAIAEIFYTFVLCFTVLCVATVKKPPAPALTAFIIGSCVTVGGLAIGKISGGSLNPAVSFGIAAARVLFGGSFFKGVIYMIFEVMGAGMAAGVFKVVYPGEHAAVDAKETNKLTA